ncbi:MAG: EAL domain-containing protein, partial [Gammaproteobacteria bacterium]|nr:EAL domain-containing protein [Gammaproteobacteria bacterium]
HIKCSVNLSARQFRDNSTIKLIEELDKGCVTLSDCIEMEITETMLVENVEMASYIMDKLHAFGIKVSVDDFGTGYSSMSYLKRFPLDALKIDRSFVKDTPGDPDDVAITQAIIALGHSLNLRVIAEGVETEAQYDFLKEQGCDEIQGFLISRAMSEENFKQWLIEHLENVKKIQNG